MAENKNGGIITKENFNQMLEELIVCNIAAQHYNRDCVSNYDLWFAEQTRSVLGYLIHQIVEKGYNPVSLIAPTMGKYKYILCVEKDTGKSELDDDFSIDMNKFSHLLQFAEETFQDNQESAALIIN